MVARHGFAICPADKEEAPPPAWGNQNRRSPVALSASGNQAKAGAFLRRRNASKRRFSGERVLMDGLDCPETHAAFELDTTLRSIFSSGPAFKFDAYSSAASREARAISS